MTSNRLSIHVKTGKRFYENLNTVENFYNFLIAQQNEQAAFMPKNFSYRDGFEAYISQFFCTFSLDNVQKCDLYVHKNVKYSFYRFNGYVIAYGSHRWKIRHTRKLKDSVAMQKLKKEASRLW